MLRKLSSTQITVICLTLLLILTFWGTIAQVQQGLYAAQERFFNSYFFLAGGFIPFPGAQLVLWVLFVNLLAMTIVSFHKYRQWQNIGLLITHVGLLIYFVAAFMVFHASQESVLHLTQGQSTNMSVSYQDWELAYWQTGPVRQVHAVDTATFKKDTLAFNNPDFTIKVKEYDPNSRAFTDTIDARQARIINASGITRIEARPSAKEKEQNTAGGIFELKTAQGQFTLMLFGGEEQPTITTINGKTYAFILRHKAYPLPFTLTLDAFKAEFLPGTSMAKNYESQVTIKTGTLTRTAKIFMNNPLKDKDYTIYQASEDTDRSGRQYSTLAVVKNFAKVLPYIACIAVFIGLASHFLIQAFLSRIRP